MFNFRLEVVSTDKPLYQKESRIKNIRFFISIRYFYPRKRSEVFTFLGWSNISLSQPARGLILCSV